MDFAGHFFSGKFRRTFFWAIHQGRSVNLYIGAGIWRALVDLNEIHAG